MDYYIHVNSQRQTHNTSYLSNYDMYICNFDLRNVEEFNDW